MSKLDELIAASTPGELKAGATETRQVNRFLLTGNFALGETSLRVGSIEAEANARRLALSWNHFPEVVRLLTAIEDDYSHDRKATLNYEQVKVIRALLTAIEKESAL